MCQVKIRKGHPHMYPRLKESGIPVLYLSTTRWRNVFTTDLESGGDVLLTFFW